MWTGVAATTRTPEEAQHQQQRDGSPGLDGGNDRARGQEADDAAGITHLEHSVGRAGQAGGNMDKAGRSERQRCRADGDAVGRGLVLRGAQQPDAEQQQGDRDGIRDPAEGPCGDGVDDLSRHALESPPLAGGDHDRQPEQEQAHAVTAVLRVELAGTVPDPADGSAGDMGHAHPGGADRPQRQRKGLHPWPSTWNLGPLVCAGAQPGRCVRWPDGMGWRVQTSDARQGYESPQSAEYGKDTPVSRVTRVASTSIVPAWPPEAARRALAPSHIPIRTGLGSAPGPDSRYSPSQVMSTSVQPRLAGRQPSSAVGCSG